MMNNKQNLSLKNKERERNREKKKPFYHCVMLLVVVDYLYSNFFAFEFFGEGVFLCRHFF